MNEGFRRWILNNGMHLSWGIALVAFLGSLYFSEVMHFEPCKLCWYQRILMYPLVLMLGIAAVRKDHKQYLYVLPMSVIGLGFSTYHYLMQKTNWFASHANACGLIPCDTDYIDWLGFITIPLLAGIAFALITLLQIFIGIAVRERRS